MVKSQSLIAIGEVDADIFLYVLMVRCGFLGEAHGK